MSVMVEAAVESYLRTSECGIVAAAALLTFDYCLTFRREIEWLYGTKWTLARIHFTGSRYLPFVAVALAIPTSRVRPPGTSSYCGHLGTATNAVYYLCIILAEAMLIVRTYVFWRRSKKILIGLCTFGLVCIVAAVVPSVTIASQPTNPVYKALSCFGTENTIPTAIQYICLILYEMGILALNWIPSRRMRRYNNPGRLVVTLYHDNIAYMASILVFSVINAVVTLASPIQYSDILNSPQMVMHSIFATRIFFNLRETSQGQRNLVPPITLTEFIVAPSNFSNSLGSSSSGTRTVADPARINDTTQVVDITATPQTWS